MDKQIHKGKGGSEDRPLSSEDSLRTHLKGFPTYMVHP